MRNKLRLLTPGPTPIPERVRLAMARDMIHHRKPEFKELYTHVLRGLQMLFGTSGPVLPLTASGTGAMTAAVTNLFTPGETVITVEGGKFGERWTGICKTHGITAIPLRVEWGKAVTTHDIESTLDQHPQVSGILMQVAETSTGVLHPIREIAAITRKRDLLLVADGISSLSITPCPMDAWGIDCLLTGSQKGLMLPPGLSFIALSPRAWKTAERQASREYYFNLVKERESANDFQSAFTPAISLLAGLRESLAMFEESGMEAIYQKQWALTRMARAGITAMGFELFAKTHYTWGLTSMVLPTGVNAGPVLTYAADTYGIVMAAGMEQWKERVIRVGHMGWVDWADLAAGLYALGASYVAKGGHIGTRDYVEQALIAYEKGLTEKLPL